MHIEGKYKSSGKTTAKAIGLMTAMVIPAALGGAFLGVILRVLMALLVSFLGAIGAGITKICGVELCICILKLGAYAGFFFFYFLIPSFWVGHLVGVILSAAAKINETYIIALTLLVLLSMIGAFLAIYGMTQGSYWVINRFIKPEKILFSGSGIIILDTLIASISSVRAVYIMRGEVPRD
jgi:hypothetical protein